MWSMRAMLFGWTAASCLLGAVSLRAASPNILLIVADDLGVDYVTAYGEGPAPAPTPAIDQLAAGGVLFRNAWSNPTCSPTRATILTGRYGFRTGIGQIITGSGFALANAEVTIPEALDLVPALGYAHAAVGKWHLGALGDVTAPNQAGFGYYRGELANLGGSDRPENYFRVTEVANGIAAAAEGYDTTRIVDNALAWIGTQSSPWLCGVFFHAPHAPFHAPPDALHDRVLPPGPPFENTPIHFQAMVQAMDTEIGRLLAGLGAALPNTVIIFVGDNGTPEQAALPPFLPAHAKATVFEGGVNVPLIIRGPGVVGPGREVASVVDTTDLFATILELAGVDVASTLAQVKLDSVSLVPYLANPSQGSLRAHVFAEKFAPNGFAPTSADRVIRDGRHKLRRIGVGATEDQLYDLVVDPFETTNLLAGGVGGLSPAELAAYQSLSQALAALLSS